MDPLFFGLFEEGVLPVSGDELAWDPPLPHPWLVDETDQNVRLLLVHVDDVQSISLAQTKLRAIIPVD
eukprot:CAMPEP_0184300808 /NCGR_PEP_ID=MMETSP1049-20130417/11158_1 /TAXON_ID=77928 /ORGANISM="Proteomonas sulcata, Strain CCMP704" /LENGTH=67 /DNA_ID=CAMNT_0026611635 /DNA_START=571 /DNA_END=771 /DNA_ORIENTATION=-